ncbi:MAG: DUF1566 domain-containing protein [Steroidobacteraceae bacterium]
MAGLGTSPAVQAQSAATTGHEVGNIVLIKSGGLTYIKADGLIWTFPSHRAYWADANSYCTQSTIDGQLGWRLPNAAELERLYARHANALPPDWAGDYVWSATVAISDDPDPHASYHVVAIRSGGSGQMKDDSYRGVVTCVHDPDPPGEGLPPRVAPPGALP